ncbi:unnamed protein product, partial [Polarella glacialis]
IVDQQAAVLEPELFGPVVESLLQGAVRSEAGGRARVALLRSLAELVGRAADDCVPRMEPALVELLRAAEAELDSGRAPASTVVGCLRALILRLPAERVVSHAEALLGLFVRSLTAQHAANGSFDEDCLRAVGTLATALGARFQAGMPSFGPLLLAALRSPEEPEACLAALSALSNVAGALGSQLFPSAPAALEALASLLRRHGTASDQLPLEPRLRPRAVHCLGDILLALGANTPNLEAVLALLADEAEAAGAVAGVMPAKAGLEGYENTAGVPLARQPVFLLCKPRLGRGSTAGPGTPPASVAADATRRREILDAVLGAYEALFRACRNSGTTSVPPALLGACLPSALQLGLRLATPEDVPQNTLRLVLKFLGPLAAEMPAELRAHLSSHPDAAACVSKLASFGSVSPNKATRELSAALGQLLSST